ncbi:MAG: hypothetical protein KAS32_22770, partial [Candidatus Peribacteraceae bacterium]|nr:hypothetical protein [Candidatus Peribacteraceae bacterium]
MKIKRIMTLMLMVTLVLMLTSCLPKELKESANKIGKEIETATKNIEGNKKKWAALKASDEFKGYLPYAEKENWDKNMTDATKELGHTKKLWADIQVVIKNNSKKEASKLKGLMGRARKSWRAAYDLSYVPFERYEELKEFKETASDKQKDAHVKIKTINETHDRIIVLFNKTKKDYPKKVEDINKRASATTKTNTDAIGAVANIDKQMSNADTMDIASFANSYKLVVNTFNEIQAHEKKMTTLMSELYTSYSKRLVDMRADLFVSVSRVSWDESSDWPTEHTYNYPAKQVNEKIFNYFDSIPGEGIARGYQSWGNWNVKVKIDQTAWNSLKINGKEAWPSSWDDDSEFWVNNTAINYYHKYVIVRDGKETPTGWEKVSENFFGDQEDNLGMDIGSKPYGLYEHEAIKTAAPPGMAYVNNPKYGKWQKDEKGKSFWHWYGMYAFYGTMFGPNHYYYRNDWNHWNNNYRGRSGYYGRNDGYGTYGSRTRSNTRVASSTYAKSGGFTRQAASARTSG